MLRRGVQAALVLTGLLLTGWPSAGPLRAAETALDAIPADASVVVRLKNPEATIDKLADFVDMVQPGFGGQVRLQSQALGLAISNPTLGGVDQAADWWLAVFAPPEGGEPGVVFVIPATDVKAMKEALGDSFKFTEFGKWGVYTENDAAAEKIAAGLKTKGKSIASMIDAQSQDSFDKGDLSVFVNLGQLTTLYKDKLAGMKTQASEALEKLPDDGGANLKVISQISAKFLSRLFQGIEDARSFTTAINISKQGISIEELLRVKTDSATDKFLKTSAPSEIALLSTLPAGQLGYVGLQVDMAAVIKLGTSLLGAVDGNEEAMKKLAAIMDEHAKLKYGAMAASFEVGNAKAGALRAITVMEVDNPQKARDLTEKQTQAMDGVKTPPVTTTSSLQKDAEKIGNNSVDILTVKQSYDDDNDANTQMIEAVTKAVYGPDGMVSRFAYLKDRVVQTLGGGKDAMSRALATQSEQSAKTSAGSSKVVVQSRKQLAPKANLVVLVDLPGLLARAVQAASESGAIPFPINNAAVEGLQLQESFIGISAGTEPQGLRCNTHIPTEQIQGLMRCGLLFATLRGNFNQ